MKKYLVDVYHEVREDHWCDNRMETDSPRKAIEEWAKLSKKFPTCVSINCYKKDDVIELMLYAHDNPKYLETICEQEKVPYKLEYLQEAIERNLRTECCTFHETFINGEYYRDMVHPFDIG